MAKEDCFEDKEIENEKMVDAALRAFDRVLAEKEEKKKKKTKTDSPNE